jgi:putative flippase GtrA
MPAAPVDQPRTPNLILRLLRDQRVQYLIVGGLNTLVGFGLFVGFDLTVGRYFDTVANTVVGSLVTLVLAHILGVLFAFTLYRRFVFKVTGHVLRDLARFESVYLVALGINAVVLPLLVQLGVNRILAQALITITTTVISYLGHRFFSFRRSPETAILEDPARLAEEQNVTGEEPKA